MIGRKGIILAGGLGTRLYPATSVISKQLLPIYDKPTIYYALATLMLSHIKDIIIISTPKDLPFFTKLLQDGKKFGINICYAEQKDPKGLAEALIIAERFLNQQPSCMILGDNLFYGGGLSGLLKTACIENRATIFTYQVSEPSRYGILSIDKDGTPLSVDEKPKKPKSNLAITGLYYFDEHAPDIAKQIKPSARNELEITDVIKIYLNDNKLINQQLSRGIAWLDTGTVETLFEANSFVSTIEKRTGLKICCPEEIAWRNNWITDVSLENLAKQNKSSNYGKYLLNILNGKK